MSYFGGLGGKEGITQVKLSQCKYAGHYLCAPMG
jgi:hypothetical protein